ncbi:LacI family DNA-binding transcriptional regulator [Natronohydrobacter thiooxidans]|jgi:DNA-binding LacI/PurR family transcriptional regulator|uniref:LacI family DNA-binding transcriptional regulator n=1 Tax=Natronohydrobacter thiooxidans TaxID=87172 RepID=UPI0008FF282A|nr:LacI family DNA-binding transcriptional regulator [Natronohydrobacter thiooxidans]
MVSIKGLAKHLDISIGTVSRALNGRPDVNEETRQRVLKAADELGYAPNQAGRALRKGSTGVIGFMMQTGAEITGDGDTFFMSVFDGVQTVLSQHGLDLVVLLCAADQDREEYLRRTVARGFADALIISGTRIHDGRIDFLVKRKIPFIALGRSETDLGQPWFDLDFEGFAKSAVARLVDRGYRKIAISSASDDTNLGKIFIESSRMALHANGLELDDRHIFRTPPNERGGYQLAQHLLSGPDRPDAMVLVNELTSVGFYRGLRDGGIEPGRDMGIIGFRESPQSRYISPALTCFRIDLHGLGRALAQTLLSTMPAYKERIAPPPGSRVWPIELIEGESDPRRESR